MAQSEMAGLFTKQPKSYVKIITMASVVGTIPKSVRLNSAGVLRVGDSRVSLDSVVYAFNRGESAAEIQDAFDSLSLAEVHAAIAYYLHNKPKVDEYLAKKEIEFEKNRAANHKQNRALIEKLHARKNGTDPDWKK